MGEILLKYYKEAGDSMGLVGKMQLAQETKMPSAKAAVEADTPEKIEMFRKAYEKVTGKPAPRF